MDHWFCDEPFVCGHLKPSAFVPAKGSASKKRPLPLASCCSVTGLNPRLVFDAPMATAVTFPDKKEMMALADKKPVDDRERKPGKAKHSHRIHVPYKSKLEASSSSGLRVIVRSSSPSASPLYESRAPKTFSGSFRFTACPVSHSKRRATQKTKQKGGWPFLPIFAHGLDLRMPVDPVPTTLQSEPAVETRPVSPFEPAAFDKQPGAEECLVDPDSLLSGGSALVASPPCAVLFSYSMPGLRRVDILQTLACALDSIVSTRNDVLPKPATLFHSVSVPLVSAGTYLKHLASKLCFSVQACVIGFAFLDMFAQHQTTSPFVEVDQLTVHRLLLTCLMCSHKMVDDSPFRNGDWAFVGGVTRGEILRLELELMTMLKFTLLPTWSMFFNTLDVLCRPHLHESCKDSECAGRREATLSCLAKLSPPTLTRGS